MSLSNHIPINLQSVIDTTDNGFVVIDKDYNIIAANKAYYDAYGVDSESIVGKKCHKVSHHSDFPCHLNGEDCPHKKVFETEKPHQVLHIHYGPHNEEAHVRIKGSPIYGSNGELFLGEGVFPIAKSDVPSCNQQRMLGNSPAFLACIEEMAGAATSDIPILLNGESGVGKELAAKFIHHTSGRRAQPFISVDCTAISEGMFESELFGHERGAFTGCVGRRQGLIEAAENGTIFMDNISEVPLALQGRLLRVLETGNFRHLGSREDLHVDARVICATNNNLRKMVDLGTFRADLYYRIAGISITIPPLRQRRSDILPLIKAMLAKIKRNDSDAAQISEEAIEILQKYDYPGNIRELHNILKNAAAISPNSLITPDFLKLNNSPDIYRHSLITQPADAVDTRAKKPSTNRSLTDVEATHIESLLHQHDGHRAKVAEALRISERTLYRKIKLYNLQYVGKRQG